jgi:hypothetical protein
MGLKTLALTALSKQKWLEKPANAGHVDLPTITNLSAP